MSGIIGISPDMKSGVIGELANVGQVAQMKYKRHFVDGHHNLSSSSGWVSHGDEAGFTFSFKPLSAKSTICLEYFQGVTHTSTGGGYGHMAFTKDGSRSSWGGGLAGYNDGYGHFWTGFATYDSVSLNPLPLLYL